ncbi:unnamed protein product [Rhizophagus irregularis]|nr:unnamed protein product [Rhizophagus irregularis]
MPIPVDPKKIAFLFIILLPLVFFVFLFVNCTIIALVPIWLPFAVSFAGRRVSAISRVILSIDFRIASLFRLFILSRVMGSLKPVQNLPETSQTLSKYEDRPGQIETFLAYTNNNFSWPPSMPEYIRRYCFHQITGTGSNIDVQSGRDIIFFYNALERGEFLGHENDWVTVYNQEIKAYGKEYSDDELNHIFKEMPGAIQLPVNQKSLPRSKKRKMARVGVRRPEEPELVALINYNLYDRYDNHKKYECVIDTGAPSTIFPFQIKRTLGDEGWNLRPIAGSGYGGGVTEIHANKMFEVRLGDRRNWTKWVPAKITVWDQKPGDEVEHALIGNDVTDQLAYAHEPNRPIKFLDSTDEEKLTQFLSTCN